MANDFCDNIPNYQIPWRDSNLATDCGNVCNIVWGNWNHSGQLANDWFNAAQQYLCAIAGQEPVDANVNIEIPEIASATVNMSIGEVPVPDTDKFALTNTVRPTVPALQPVRSVDAGVAPTNTIQKPTLVFPSPPAELVIGQPGDAPVLTYDNAPVADDYVLPNAPSLRDVILPAVPTLTDIPDYDETLPSQSISLPVQDFTYTEGAYAGELVDEINTALLAGLEQNSTGLSATAEQTLYDRATDRNNAEARVARLQVAEEMANRGFDLPPGAMNGSLLDIEKARLDKLGEVNREVYLDQSKRAYEFHKFAIQMAVQWEGELMRFETAQRQRLFETARFTQELLFKRFDAEVALFNARLSAYRVGAEVYKTRVEANLATLEQYKLQLEAAKIEGELRIQDVRIYEAQIAAVKAQIDVYKTEVEAFTAKTRAEGLKIENYKSEVEAYTALVGAKTEEYRAFDSQVRAELGKAQVYSTEIDAYKAEVQAFVALVEASEAQQKGDLAINQLNIESFKANLAGFAAGLDAEVERVKAEAAAFDAQVKGYAAKVEGQSAEGKLEQTRYQIEATNSFNNAQLRLREAQANVENAQKALTLTLELNRSGADIAAGVGSAAFAAVSTQASLSGYSTITGYDFPVYDGAGNRIN